MKSMKKAIALTLCAVMLVVGSVAGTMAYLTYTTDAVTNTFTVGNVKIDLDEADVKPDGTIDTQERVKGNEYHLLPGHTYIKDPTVTVKANSEDAYVRMKITVENINDLKAALPNSGETAKYYASNGVFLLQKLIAGWDANTWEFAGYTPDANNSNNGIYEFRYNGIVVKSTTDTTLDALFDTFTIPGEIDNAHLACLDKVNIIATAEAIQADGFVDQNYNGTASDEAWGKWK